MKIHFNIDSIEIKNPVVTVGTFDGLHLGHGKVIETLVDKSSELKTESVVLTFWPHPRFVLGLNTKDLRLLNTLDEKIELFKDKGIDHLIVMEFTKEFANLTSYEFVKQILHEKLDISFLIVGHDHQFGKNREGRFDRLKKCAEEFNFEIKRVEVLSTNGLDVSSTKVRNLLSSGNVQLANNLLGYNYFIIGKVVVGDKIGRTINFPTANINVDEFKALPKNGVYAVKVNFNYTEYFGMLNIGYRPTINNKEEKKIEVHIFNFDKKIYNEKIKITFCNHIRDEVKFETLDLLKNQLIKDKIEVEEYFLTTHP